MVRLLKFLWTGSWHEHKWTIIDKSEIEDNLFDYPIGVLYHLQCDHCGDVTSRRLSA